jgi:hypothetical protein
MNSEIINNNLGKIALKKDLNSEKIVKFNLTPEYYFKLFHILL